MVKPVFLSCSDPEVASFFPSRPRIGDDEIGIALLLKKDDVPFAGGIVKKIDPENYEIVYLYVLEKLRQKGLGSLVIRFLEEKVRTMGGRYVLIAPPLFLVDHLEDDGYLYFPGASEKGKPRLGKTLEGELRPYFSIGGKR